MSKLSSARAGVPSAKQPGAKPGSKRGFRGFRKVRRGVWWKGNDDSNPPVHQEKRPGPEYCGYSFWGRP